MWYRPMILFKPILALIGAILIGFGALAGKQPSWLDLFVHG